MQTRVRTPAGTAGVGFFSPFLPLCGRTAVGGAGSGAGPWDTAAGRAVRVRGEGRERRGGSGCALVPLAAPGGRTSRRRPSAGAARLHRPQHSQRRLFRPSPGPRRAGLRQRRRACVFVCARAWCPVPVRASLCRVLRVLAAAAEVPASCARTALSARPQGRGRGGPGLVVVVEAAAAASQRVLFPLGASARPALVWSLLSEAPALCVLPHGGGEGRSRGGCCGAGRCAGCGGGLATCAPAVDMASR